VVGDHGGVGLVDGAVAAGAAPVPGSGVQQMQQLLVGGCLVEAAVFGEAFRV
jgi:hypothetical protein